MLRYYGLNGSSYQVCDKPFSEGGEGYLYDVIGMPNCVAKIFKPEKLNVERERKTTLLVSLKPNTVDQYAWPLDIIRENGKFVGYIMPKVIGKTKLRNIYVFDNRKGKPWQFYVAIAKNLAAAVHNVHEIHQVIGDLSPDNILVDPNNGMVTLVDIDSYHITASGRTYRCGVGTPEFVAPEIQGLHFPSAQLPTFAVETDRFALAVLVFSLLMNGAHPYACKVISGSSSKFQQIDNIAKGMCPYFPETRYENTTIPPYSPELKSLPDNMQELFKRAFILGHKNPSARPSAEEWYLALGRMETNLATCHNNPKHIYYHGAQECPWCYVEKKMKNINQMPFNNNTVSSGANSSSSSQSNHVGVQNPVLTPSSFRYAPTSSATSQSVPPSSSKTIGLSEHVPTIIGILLMIVFSMVLFFVPSIRESIDLNNIDFDDIWSSYYSYWFALQFAFLIISVVLGFCSRGCDDWLHYLVILWILCMQVVQVSWTLFDLGNKAVWEWVVSVLLCSVPNAAVIILDMYIVLAISGTK